MANLEREERRRSVRDSLRRRGPVKSRLFGAASGKSPGLETPEKRLS